MPVIVTLSPPFVDMVLGSNSTFVIAGGINERPTLDAGLLEPSTNTVKARSFPTPGTVMQEISVFRLLTKQFFAVYWVVLPPRGPYLTTTLAFFPVKRYLKSVGPKFVPYSFSVAPPLVSRL